jgi:hypothetical protein
MTKFFEIILENCMNGNVRMIVIEREGEEGVRSVNNICESSVDSSYTSRFFGDVIDLLESEGTVTLKNENVDFGRAKRWNSKVSKIISTLVNENRSN